MDTLTAENPDSKGPECQAVEFVMGRKGAGKRGTNQERVGTSATAAW